MNDKPKKNIFTILFVLGFLFAFGTAIPTYINSTFLNTFIEEELVGIVYVVGSILTIFGLMAIQPLLKRYGNYKVTSLFFVLNFLLLSVLAFSKSAPVIISTFVTHFALNSILAFNLDVFIEKYSTDAATGGIRGSFLTVTNLAWVLSPMIAGFLLTNGDYWKIYSLAAFLSLPILAILFVYLGNFKDSEYKKVPILSTFRQICKNKNIYKILISSLMLRFFYAWMVIYTPIYLHQNIGFDWSVIGVIFTIMLLPFVLLEYPLGWLADKKYGEKEILSIGFLIIALSSATMSFIDSSSAVIWTLVLISTRIGASMVEIMSETYFFKQIGGKDTDILGFYRTARPFAYIISPIVATAVLSYIDFRYIFLVLGVIMLYGLRYSLTLKDTK